MIEEKVITEREIDEYEKEIAQMVEESVIFAEESPEPSLEHFLEEVKSI